MNDLRQAVQDVIREHGFEILQEPKRLIGSVLDSAELETAAAAALESACDEGFFANFASLLQEDASAQVDDAVARAVDYLSGEHAIDADIARELATGFAEGIAASVEEATADKPADDEAADAEASDEPADDEASDEPADDEASDEPAVDNADEPAADENVDEKVEAAVRNVAEEAEAEEAAADEDAANEEDVPATKKRERRSKQARAAKASRDEAEVEEEPAAKGAAKLSFLDTLTVPAWIGISVACLALGLLLGRFVLGGGGAGVNLTGKTAVAEAQLDDAYATYTYNGQKYTLSVRDVIEQVGTVESAVDEEGNYTLPSADYALSAARNAILEKEIESRNIEVTDEDLAAYAEKNLGTSDYEAIGSAYGMEAAEVEELLRSSCRMNALREEIVGGTLPEMPAAPETPEEGKEQEATKAYADYIISLAGDEWDADAGDWASADGRYATALEGYEVTTDGATYDAATAAYYMAYQIYSEEQTTMANTWTEYLNGLLSNANIQIGTLIS